MCGIDLRRSPLWVLWCTSGYFDVLLGTLRYFWVLWGTSENDQEGRSPQIYTAHKIWSQNLLAGVHCSLLVIPVGILTQFTKSINLTIILTWPNFYGTFKYHESHSNNHIFKCYWPGMTIYSLCNHFCNHKYHYDSIACLGVEIRFLIKKLWWKRCFYTVFQESPF